MNDNAQAEGFNEDPAPDFTEDKWLDDNVKAAVENLQEILYDAGCGVNGLHLVVPSLPGENEAFSTDYGKVQIVAAEVE